MDTPELYKTTDLETEHGWKWLMDAAGHVWFHIDGTYYFPHSVRGPCGN